MSYTRTREQRHAEYLRTKDKCLARAKNWAEANPAKRQEILKRWNKKAATYKREWAQKKDFGVTIELDMCKLCDITEKLVIHHRDGNNGKQGKPLNNDINNLIVLCRSCHARVHSHGEVRVFV